MSAAFKATEGNGGAPVVVGREPVEGPDIPRGAFYVSLVSGFYRFSEVSDEGAVTFSRDIEGYRVTYHDVQIIGGSPTFGLQAFVGPHDVVTWEKV